MHVCLRACVRACVCVCVYVLVMLLIYDPLTNPITHSLSELGDIILRGDEAVVEAAEMLMVVMYVNVCMRGCDAPLQIFRDML